MSIQVNVKLSATAQQVLRTLQVAYPRAMFYADIYKKVAPGVATQRMQQHGGPELFTLVKKGLAKKITTGTYCYVPQ
jgi:hypothetical protein